MASLRGGQEGCVKDEGHILRDGRVKGAGQLVRLVERNGDCCLGSNSRVREGRGRGKELGPFGKTPADGSRTEGEGERGKPPGEEGDGVGGAHDMATGCGAGMESESRGNHGSDVVGDGRIARSQDDVVKRKRYRQLRDRRGKGVTRACVRR